MKLDLSLAVTALALAPNVIASTEEKLEKRAFEATTGAPGNAAPRLEIYDLKRNADQWNIYLLGMREFQQMDQRDKWSYYQIAGIHGVPFTMYNDVPGVRLGGYCPHASNMFLPWHAPYLAHFEQGLLRAVQRVVDSFPQDQRQRWQNAAANLRIPYWDWAKTPPQGEEAVPRLIRDQQVSVTTPQGQQTIANPLYSFNFHPPSDELGGAPFNYWQYTWRRPVMPAETARSNNNEFTGIMNNEWINMRRRTYDLLRNQNLYRLFSTEATGQNTGNPEQHDSIESVHDTIHIVAGGETGGHMYYLDWSGFDPLFWLHHTNIDRLGRIYQVIHPDTWVEPGAITQNNWQWTIGESKNEYTPLKPFTKDDRGTFWTGHDVRDSYTLNYYYPETVRGATAQSALNAVENLYRPINSRRRRARTEKLDAPYPGHPLEAGERQYDCKIQTKKFAVAGSYFCKFYLGGGMISNLTNATTHFLNSTINKINQGYNATILPTLNDTLVKPDPNYVGMYAVLGPKDKVDAETVVSGAVPLTAALQGKNIIGELADLTETAVTAYLTKHLSWKCFKSGGESVKPEDIGGLSVSVTSNELKDAGSSTSLPTWGPTIYHPDVTTGKPGGSSGYGPGSTSGSGSGSGSNGGSGSGSGSGSNSGSGSGSGSNGGSGSGSTGGNGQCPAAVEYKYVDENGQAIYGAM